MQSCVLLTIRNALDADVVAGAKRNAGDSAAWWKNLLPEVYRLHWLTLTGHNFYPTGV